MTVGIIGIIVALVIFLYGAYRNVSVMWLAPLCGVIVAVTNGLNPTNAFTGFYVGAVEENAATGLWSIGGLCGMLVSIFPTVFLGGIFGKVITDGGAAQAIASTLVNKFVFKTDDKIKMVRRAILIMLIIEMVLSYGGVDAFVAIFATFPIAIYMASRIGIPRRYVPAILALACGASGAPYILSIHNIVSMNILGTSAGAAPVPGFISLAVMETGIYFICTHIVIKAMKKGETFDYGPLKPIPQDNETKLPNFVVSLIPLVIVFLLFAIVQNASLALCCGIISTVLLMAPYFKDHERKGAFTQWGSKVIHSINEGAVNGASALMTLCAAAGFAAVVQHTSAFNGMVDALFGLPVAPLILATVLCIIIVAFTSSPPAALSIAIPMVAAAFIWTDTPTLNPAALHRIAALSVQTFETLPVNGMILLTTGLCQVKIKDAYLPMFLQSVVMTTIGTILCLIILTIAPGLA